MADPGFTTWAPTRERAPTYYLAIFSHKLHVNEEILGRGRGGGGGGREGCGTGSVTSFAQFQFEIQFQFEFQQQNVLACRQTS